MGTIQLIQVTPNELVNLISESVKAQFKELSDSFNSSSSDDKNDLLTRKETADLLQISLVTLHEWTNHKLLTSFKLGNRTYYKKSQVLEALFNSNK